MSNVRFSKVVSNLPATLQKDTIYLVKKNDQVHSYVTNSVGETVPFIMSTTKESLNLENVDNTADIDKPVSSPVQSELDERYTKAESDETFAPINVQRQNLPGRLRYCSYFTGIYQGDYVDNGVGSYVSQVGTIPANILVAFPFVPEHTVTMDEIGLNITSARNNEFYSLGLYTSNPTNRAPDSLMQETGPLSTASTGYASTSLNPMLTVESGELYYIAAAMSRDGAAFSTIPPGNCLSIGGVSDPSGDNYFNCLQVPFTFTDQMPSVWPEFSTTQRSSHPTPSVRLRVDSANVSFM